MHVRNVKHCNSAWCLVVTRVWFVKCVRVGMCFETALRESSQSVVLFLLWDCEGLTSGLIWLEGYLQACSDLAEDRTRALPAACECECRNPKPLNPNS